MNLLIRNATQNEAEKLAELSIMASGGTFELLLQGLKRNVGVHQVLSELCRSELTEYSYRYFRVAELDGNILGAVNIVSVKDRYELAPNINPLLQQKFGFGAWQLLRFYKRARHIRNMNTIKCPGESYHINDIAVLPEARGQGIGKKLVEVCKQEGKMKGNTCISLYVWGDNTKAINFYKKNGFITHSKAGVRPHRFLPHNESVLMLYDLS